MKLHRFIIHDADGRVTGTATGTRESVTAALADGCGAVRSDHADPDAMRVVDGRLRPRLAAEHRAAIHGVAMQRLRAARNARLTACDWTQTLDQPEALRAAWAAYRAELRALPETVTDPEDFTWPKRPNEREEKDMSDQTQAPGSGARPPEQGAVS